MTAQILASELSTLIQDSKRKNADIRSAAEKSLSDLKALPNTSELQLAADLKRRPNFVRPFLLSCASKNLKFAGTSISCLQRLVVSNGLAPETLKDVLDVLRDCTSLAQDIQLKILQVLPSLLQNYAGFLTGDLLATALHICFLLFASKTGVISNTAAATLQQLVVSVLGKVVREDEAQAGGFVAEVPVEDGSIEVRNAALDAYRLLNDVCLLAEGHKPTFLHPASMPPNFGLELVESMLSNHAETVSSHPELIHILRVRLLPFIIRALSERVMFSTTVRAMRLLPIIFGNMLSVLRTECEMVLSLLNHMLDPDAAILWKRVLCMEVFRGIHAEPALVRSIYSHFDEQDGKRNIIRDHLAIIVRLASEKPSIIGLGQQSSVPASSGQTEDEMDEMAALQAEGIAGTIGVAMTLRASTAPGISTRLSTMRIPCIEQLDKNDPPPIPPAYLYTLALTCMNSFSEGLARFLLPFTVPNESRSKRKQRPAKDGEGEGDEEQRPKLLRSQSSYASRIPINPLSLEHHVLYGQIKTSASIVDACWPALLAAYSTFLHAALDSEYYHALIRSFQKFSQVAGLLRQSTPRDAFLTTLGKNAVPSAIISIQSSDLPSDSRSTKQGTRSNTEKESLSVSSANEKGRQSMDYTRASLNTRNLLCLRALLNLGIALGPVLQAAWSIILETLQQADLVINHILTQRRQARGGHATPTTSGEVEFLGDIGNEIAAVKIAATRMLESSCDLPDESFLDVIASMSGLLRDSHGEEEGIIEVPASATLSKSRADQVPMTPSRVSIGHAQDPRANAFVVENLGKVVEYNESRLLEQSTNQNGWHIIVNLLIKIVTAQHFDASLRIQATNTLCSLVSITSSSGVSEETREEMRLEGLVALTRQIDYLGRQSVENKASKSCELEIHYTLLETLRGALEKYGDSLTLGWEHVFKVVASVFESPIIPYGDGDIEGIEPVAIRSRSSKLVRSSFGSLQLICSDFLASVPENCLPTLLTSIHSFCCQQDEFNISLTSTTLFCNVSDYLWQGEDLLHLEKITLISPHGYSAPQESSNGEATKADMFMHLLNLLAQITMDQRLEIRHGAIHSIFRVFDSCGDKLRPADWMVCQRLIVLTLFSYNEESYQKSQAKQGSTPNPDTSSWNDAAIILLDNSSNVFGLFMPIMIRESEFPSIWSKFVHCLKCLLDRSDLNVSGTVFTSIGKILSELGDDAKRNFSECIHPTWELWRDGNPVKHQDLSRKVVSNQAALLAYVQCLAEIYPLMSTFMGIEEIQSILKQLRLCATGSSSTSYSDDIDNLTPLQDQIMRSLSYVGSEIPASVPELTRSISDFVTLPYERDIGTSGRGPTFVALSKAAMSELNSHMTKYSKVDEVYTTGGFVAAIRALVKPISLKYGWKLEGRDPPTWQNATTTLINILEASVPVIKRLQIRDTEESPLWQEIVTSCNGIISADLAVCTNPSRINSDQDFDISSFLSLYSLLVPTLGSTLIADPLRRTFASSIFRNSLIHEPHPDDLPSPSSSDAVLDNLASQHIGRTKALPPTRRSKTSYVLLDKLFDLVAVHDSSPERVRLAQAAAPFLILRVGVVLKAYILDQPLRGRMPQPQSQRKELLYILRKLVELDSEPKAIPDAPGVVSDNKKHLHRVYGLVTRALPVAKRDREVQGALVRVIETVAQGFGV